MFYINCVASAFNLEVSRFNLFLPAVSLHWPIYVFSAIRLGCAMSFIGLCILEWLVQFVRIYVTIQSLLWRIGLLIFTCANVCRRKRSVLQVFYINYSIIVYFLFDFSFIFAKFAENFAPVPPDALNGCHLNGKYLLTLILIYLCLKDILKVYGR